MEAIRFYFYISGAYLKSRMQYKVSILSQTLGLFFSYGLEMFGLWALLEKFETIAGWNYWEVAFLFSLGILSWGFCVLFILHFRELERLIIKGEFDRFLVRPWSPFLQFLSSRIEIFSAGQFIFSITLLIVSSNKLGLQWSINKLFILLLVVIGGVLIQSAAVIICGSISFWTLKSRSIYDVGIRITRQMTWYPITIFPTFMQFILTFIIPFSFINFFPSQYFLQRNDISMFHPIVQFLTPIIGIAFFLLALMVWNRGIDHYKGTGS